MYHWTNLGSDPNVLWVPFNFKYHRLQLLSFIQNGTGPVSTAAVLVQLLILLTALIRTHQGASPPMGLQFKLLHLSPCAENNYKLLGNPLPLLNTLSHQLVLIYWQLSKCTKIYRFKHHISKKNFWAFFLALLPISTTLKPFSSPLNASAAEW